jgi:hypothetical protein
MGRFSVAWRAFIAALTDAAIRARLEAALTQTALPQASAVEKTPRQAPVPEPAKPAKSEALTLLAALQREARLIDLVKQPLTEFSDEEIGAASRNVLADCRAVLDRFFQIEPLLTQPEGAPCDVPPGYDPANYKLSGRVEGPGPFRGQLIHHGWRATAQNLPTWTGSKTSTQTLAPAEIEIP